MKNLTTVAILFCACVALGQTKAPTPGSLTVVFDGQPSGCNVVLVSCVSQVNGIAVCPFGRVAFYPLPGQPYTPFTYPKVDQNNQPINTLKCVSTLPSNKPWTDPNWLTAPHF